MALLRQSGFRGHICLGGHFPTFRYNEILGSCGDIDSIIRFEGEESFLELLGSHHNGLDWRHIPGIAFRTSTAIQCNSPRPLIPDLDTLPFPVRDHMTRAMQVNRTITISGSRGCWCDCSFCTVTSFYSKPNGSRWRGRSPSNIVDEMESLAAQYDCNSFTFVDDNYMGVGRRGKERARGIADEILRRGMKVEFSIECRADDIERELMRYLMQAGLRSVFVGLESGLDSRLSRLGKRNQAGDNIHALEVLSELNLNIVAGFILFDPYVTLEEILSELKFLRQYGVFDLPALIRRVEVRPGMRMYSALRSEGRLFGTQFAESYEFEDQRVAKLFQAIMGVLPWHVATYMRCRELKRKQILGKQIADDFLYKVRFSALDLVESIAQYIGLREHDDNDDYKGELASWKAQAEVQSNHLNKVLDVACAILPDAVEERVSNNA